ncbi:hypothetical protein predicted by Glimmer/Critica [Sorangium cellulosum So ce56]|uniref:Uncharacterized protein n=1 Tax=Sorangium cellulosum (strain So ce56) TaxID=448385 RepID=A9FY96_SORC5|nr:hypothetical protein [Sorangium cellulosum]CAN95597.1 hypothetical protein predicted by Glimmer/Critica [Sorangium cellulosum So ce56]
MVDVLGRRVADVPANHDYGGEVTAEDCDRLLGRITALHARVLGAAAATVNHERADALRRFAVPLEKTFYGFEPDFFQQNLVRIVDDVISQFKGSLELWPTLVEICYLQKSRAGLPQSLHHVACTPRSWLGWRCRPPCTIFSDVDATHRSARVVAGER